MTTFPISNWLLSAPAYNRANLALPAGSQHQPEPFSLMELSRSVSRWENEGGAIHENSLPLQSAGAQSNNHIKNL